MAYPHIFHQKTDKHTLCIPEVSSKTLYFFPCPLPHNMHQNNSLPLQVSETAVCHALRGEIQEKPLTISVSGCRSVSDADG